MLYKLKTSRLFDRTKLASPEPDEDPFAVQHVCFDSDSSLEVAIVCGETHR